jgi:hypothetical protein
MTARAKGWTPAFSNPLICDYCAIVAAPMTSSSATWLYWAFLSAVFAGLAAVFAEHWTLLPLRREPQAAGRPALAGPNRSCEFFLGISRESRLSAKGAVPLSALGSAQGMTHPQNQR